MAESVYCGPAPLPSTLWMSWNFDVPLLLALLATAVGLAVTGQPSLRGRVALAAGMAALLVAFISPLCALATALLSARVTHHVLMIAVAAPLLALAAPRLRPPIRSLTAIVVLHALVVWLWHVPAAYAWALSGTAPYAVMEMSLMLSALWLWSGVLASTTPPVAALAALLATIMQMGFLGAILTFARTPLYEQHAGTTAAFGLTQLEDQQLAGLIMWMPAAIPYLIAAGLIAARLLPREPDQALGGALGEALGEARGRDA
jgi:putative membrane protein